EPICLARVVRGESLPHGISWAIDLWQVLGFQRPEDGGEVGIANEPAAVAGERQIADQGIVPRNGKDLPGGRQLPDLHPPRVAVLAERDPLAVAGARTSPWPPVPVGFRLQACHLAAGFRVPRPDGTILVKGQEPRAVRCERPIDGGDVKLALDGSGMRLEGDMPQSGAVRGVED